MIESGARTTLAIREHGKTRLVPKVLQTHRGALDLVLLNVENPLWEKELDQFQVRGIPTVLFYGPDGSVRGRSVGLQLFHPFLASP